jgi:hypothetical protein
MSLKPATLDARRGFGFLFICVAISVTLGAVLSEIAYGMAQPPFMYAAIWVASFGAVFAGGFRKIRKIAPSIRARMKGSITWPHRSKLVNGICWAGPFVAIAAFPSLYQYLILLGIGLGNLSTYVLIKKYKGGDNREQLVVASVSLAAIPIALLIDNTLLAARQDIAVMASRIMIAASYGAGGLFGLSGKDTAISQSP